VHDLTRDTLDRDEKLYKKEFAISGFQPRHLWESQYLLKQIERGAKCRRWKVVTLVRDPIARNISGFFQTLQSEFGLDYEKAESMDEEDVARELVDIFLEKVTWHDYPLTWFDTELKSVLCAAFLWQGRDPRVQGKMGQRERHERVCSRLGRQPGRACGEGPTGSVQGKLARYSRASALEDL
jgi:hypothetical protein